MPDTLALHASHRMYRCTSHLAARRARYERRVMKEARSNRQLVNSMPRLPDGRALSLQARGIKGVGSVGLGGKLWPAAVEVCHWLRGQSLIGKSIFELGCGTGVVGLFAAALGAAEVTLTDGGGRGVLDVAKQNLERNRALLTNAERVRVLEYNWGSRLETEQLQRLDLVLASDCTYVRSAHLPLCESIRWLLTSSLDGSPPRVVIAHQRRTFFFGDRDGDDQLNVDHHLAHFCKVAAASGLRTSVVPLRKDVSLLEVSLEPAA